MFRQALVRLTLWYFAVIVLISIIFSVVLYEVATRELSTSLRPPDKDSGIIIGQEPFSGDQAFQTFRATRLQESHDQTITNIIYLNIYVLVVGGILSYLLARYTLEPIEAAHLRERQFTGDASHELRTPLSAMRSQIEVALRQKHIDEQEGRELLASNLEEIDKLTTLSNSLLKLARQTKIPENAFSNISLEELTNKAIKALEPNALKKKITVTADLENIEIQAEPAMIQELITIILDNAVKYSPDGQEVNITLKPIDHNVLISVEDHGRGIPDKDLPHIFKRFFRSDISRSVTPGHGLGLSIAKQIVELHHGKIQAHSKEGIGTVISIVLPTRQHNPRTS